MILRFVLLIDGRSVSTTERMRRVDELLSAFGLQQQAHSLVGTPIRKGISGGQKRRLSIASQLITAPKILFLDVSANFLADLMSLVDARVGAYKRFGLYSQF